MGNIFVGSFSGKRLICPDTYELTFQLSEPIDFKPGQYVWVQLEKMKGEEKDTTKAFSIVSPPQSNKSLKIVFRKGISDYKKNLLRLKVSDKVKIIGPFGFFTLPNDERPVILIAGGVGISPFFSMLYDNSIASGKRETRLVYLNSSTESAPYIKELETLKKEMKNFDLINLEKFNWDRFNDFYKELKSPLIYISGPREMVQEVASILTGKGLDKNSLRFEEFYINPVKKISDVPEQQRYLLAVESAFDHIIITDINGVIVYANPAVTKITGFDHAELIGNTPRLWGGLMDKKYYENLWDTIKNKKKVYVGEVKNRRKNGVIYWALIKVSPIFDIKNNLIGFIGTEQDITRQKEVDRAKSEFVSLASHQLRTPLSTINWYLETLIAQDLGKVNPKQMNYLKEAYNASKALSSLANSLLNVSRIEMGTLLIEPEDLNITDPAKETVKELKIAASKKDVKIIEDYDKDSNKVKADPKILSIIFQNLLSNAIKYNKKGGLVKFSIHRSGNSLTIAVSDQGIGIPLDQQDKIFEKLYRAENAQEVDPSGNGLGLYIVKEVVEKSGGNIWFESNSNSGTTFYVRYPKSGMIKTRRDQLVDKSFTA